MNLLAQLKTLARIPWNAPGVIAVRAMLFEAYERAAGYPIEKDRFEHKLGYRLNLKNPRSLNEKIVWKKLFDRNPLLPYTSDKYRVRQYVRDTLGEEEASQVLIPLLHEGRNPEAIPFDTLPEEYIVKTNHDSGGHHIVQRGDGVDRAAIIAKFKNLLSRSYGVFKHEWAYWSIPRTLIVEALLRGEDGDLAQDYKFHVFHGTCRFIHTTPKVNGQRSGKRSLFTPAWEQLQVGWKHAQGPNVAPPAGLERMVRLAERLAAPFDYVRVDLYTVSGRIYFGELTHYHGNGRERFDPESFDFEAGSWWNIVPNYWLKDSHAT
ncbi:MAG: ATP-grasp fold amidoligase family protein [Patescibacteria group bacterium]